MWYMDLCLKNKRSLSRLQGGKEPRGATGASASEVTELARLGQGW